MALSGNYENNLQGFVVQTEWEANQNVTANYSDLTVNLYLTINKNYSLHINSRTHTITINGTKHYVTSSPISLQGYKKNYLGTINKRIYHNYDGTLNVNFSTYFDLRATINGVYTNSINGGSKSFEITKIPRMSTINDVMTGTRELGTEHTIKIDTNFSDVVHTIWYRIRGELGSSEWYKVGENLGTSVTFTPTINHCNLQPNNETIFMDISCRTYKNGEILGEDAYSNGWYMKVPTSMVPIINNISITETVEKIKTLGVYVQNHSKLKVITNAEGIDGSTIKSVTVSVDKSEYLGNSIVTKEILSSGNVSFKITVRDTRNRIATKIETIKVENYFLPKIKIFDGKRSDGFGTLVENGRFIKVNRNFETANLNNRNVVSWKIEKRPIESENWSLIDSGSDYFLINSKEYPNISTDYAYEIKLTITDFYTTISKSFIVHTSFSIIDFHSSGKGLAFGRSATLENVFDVDMDSQFRKAIEFKQVPKINGTPIIRKPQTVSLQNGWSRYNADEPVRILKDFDGVVHIQGIIKGGTADWGTTLFVLPEIYRPKKIIYGKIFLEDYSIGAVRIETDGRVRKTYGNNEMWKKWACFDGLSFFVD